MPPATTALRPDGRQPDQMRQLRITPSYLAHAGGSALIKIPAVLLLADAVVRSCSGAGAVSFLAHPCVCE